VWDWLARREVRRLPPAVNPAEALASSPEGTRLARGGSQTVQFWDTATWQVVNHPRFAPGVDWKLPTPVSTLAFSPDGKLLAAGASRGPIKVWNVGDSPAEKFLINGHVDECVGGPVTAARTTLTVPDGGSVVREGGGGVGQVQGDGAGSETRCPLRSRPGPLSHALARPGFTKRLPDATVKRETNWSACPPTTPFPHPAPYSLTVRKKVAAVPLGFRRSEGIRQ
jgi:hypothetical protein